MAKQQNNNFARASSLRANLARTREQGAPVPRGFAALSRVLARLALLAQIGKLARRLTCIPLFVHCVAVVEHFDVKLSNFTFDRT